MQFQTKMSYSQFNLEIVEGTFGLNIIESLELFTTILEVKISYLLKQCLQYNTPLALEIATKKARSQMIIKPILIKFKKQFDSNISLFSGREFNVDSQLGLIGFCDFIISKSPEQLYLDTPVVVLVEAKNEKIVGGLGQCIAEMVAAEIYNQQDGKDIPFIYGAVTTGLGWKFLKLENNLVFIDVENYYIKDSRKIVGILVEMIKSI